MVSTLAAGVFGREHPAWGCSLLAFAGALAWGEARTLPGRAGAVLLLGALALAGWRSAAPLAPTALPLDEPHRFLGSVVEDPTRNANGVRLLVDVRQVAPAEPGSWTHARGRVALQVEGLPEPLPGRGDVAVFRARLRTPWGLRNPGARGSADYLFRKEVEARAAARWPGEAAFGAPGPGTPAWLRWRRGEAGALAAAVPGQAGAALAALTVGDWSRILPATSDSFRRAGTTHLLSISGLHLGILALLTVPLLRWVLLRVPRLALACPVEPLARLAVLPLLAAYAWLAGLQASTLRSLVMAALLVVGGAFSRPVAPLGLLASAVAVLALWNPKVLGAPGLQLSAAALAGLFWLAPRLEARLSGQPDPPDPLAPPPTASSRRLAAAGAWARRLVVAGLAASLATAPVSAFHFGSASLLGVALNPVAVPLVELFCLPAALVGTALHGLWAPAGELLWRAAGAGLGLLLRVQDALVPSVPVLSSSLLGTPAGCLGALLVLVAAGLALERPARLRPALTAAAAGAAALLVPAVAAWAGSRFDAGVHLWALDVGQGQSLVLKVPPDRWVLVDAGGFPGSDFDTGEKLVVPALRALGCRRLWLAVSTHPHPDHVLGLVSAVRLARPERLWLPGAFEGDDRYAALLDAARAEGAAVEWLGPAGRVRRENFGAARLEAVHVDGPAENDRSLVLRLTAGARAALLPADVQAEGQERLLAAGFVPRCDVLVAPHHGSANALWAPFLDAARPATVFVSASGRGSLPSRAFLAAVRARGCAVLGTWEKGALRAVLGPARLVAEPAVR